MHTQVNGSRMRLTGTHFALEEMRSRVVTGLVASSAHLTSSVNSTAQSGQKSWHVHSCHNTWKITAHSKLIHVHK